MCGHWDTSSQEEKDNNEEVDMIRSWEFLNALLKNLIFIQKQWEPF